jgi:hypothetical protein
MNQLSALGQLLADCVAFETLANNVGEDQKSDLFIRKKFIDDGTLLKTLRLFREIQQALDA